MRRAGWALVALGALGCGNTSKGLKADADEAGAVIEQRAEEVGREAEKAIQITGDALSRFGAEAGKRTSAAVQALKGDEAKPDCTCAETPVEGGAETPCACPEAPETTTP